MNRNSILLSAIVGLDTTNLPDHCTTIPHCSAMIRTLVILMAFLGFAFSSSPAFAVHTFDCGGHNESACALATRVFHDGLGACESGLQEIVLPLCGDDGAPDCEGGAFTWCERPKKIGDECGINIGGSTCKSNLTCVTTELGQGICFDKTDENLSAAQCQFNFDRQALNNAVVGTNLHDGGLGNTTTWGFGASASFLASTATERGVVYSRDGCFGCYVTDCDGFTFSIGLDSFFTTGQSIENMFCPDSGMVCSNAPARECVTDAGCLSGGTCEPCFSFDGQTWSVVAGFSTVIDIISFAVSTGYVECADSFILGELSGTDLEENCVIASTGESFSVGFGISAPFNPGIFDCHTTTAVAGCLVPDDDGDVGSGSTYITDLNEAPVCNAGGPYTKECTGVTTSVSLDGSGSSDADGDALTYLWSSNCPGGSLDNDTAQSPALTVNSPVGSCNASLTVSDADESSSCSATVSVQDTIAPGVTAPGNITIQHSAPLPNAVSLGSPTVSDACDSSPSVSNDAPTAFPLGTTTVTWTVTDASSNSNTATQQITLLNTAPVANSQSPTFSEDSVANAITLTASDVNGSGDISSFNVTSGPSHGTLGGTAPNITYTPNSDYFGPDSLSFTATDIHGVTSTAVAVSITVTPINDQPVISINRTTATVQYSDTIGTVTITATDVDDGSLILSSLYTDSAGPGGSPLPDNLSIDPTVSPNACTAIPNDTSEDGTSCSWKLTGQMLEDAGDYDITFTVTDSGGGTTTIESASDDTEIIVNAEDATISFEPTNAVAIQVDGDGSDSSLPFSLTVYIEETEPDIATFMAMYGDLSLAVPHIVLTPVGPGGPESPDSCDTPTVADTEYDQVMTFTCHFIGVPVNAYSVDASVNGGYYTGGNDDVFTVYDPSLGFTTGGGWFYWPETDDKTNFGYVMRYNRRHTKIQGSLLLIRHVAGSTTGEKYRIKSNQLEGLSIGSDPDFDWAVFSGKNTYRAPGVDNEGNNEFTVYVEDHGEPGVGVDQFWIQTRDQQDNVRSEMSLPEPGAGNTITIEGGNIVVPHGN